MSTFRRQVERRIKKKESEIQELMRDREKLLAEAADLDTKIREAQAWIEGARDTLGLAPRVGEEVRGEEETELREGSLPAAAYGALRQTGRPMHVTELLEALGKEKNRKNLTSLSGSLAAYVRKGEIFNRPKPNTFGLLAWEESDQGEPTEEGAEGEAESEKGARDGDAVRSFRLAH